MVKTKDSENIEVLIIGCGLSGASTAYHLAQQGIETMVIEAGKVFEGSDDMLNGTAGPNIPTHSKMITTYFDTCYKEFKEIHGKQNAKTFLELLNEGCEMQKGIAKKIGPDVVRELGSLSVGKGEVWEHIKKEKKVYEKLGFGDNLKTYSEKDLSDIYCNGEGKFDGGLFLPQDAVIDEEKYIKGLVNHSKITVIEKTKVTGIEETEDGVLVKTDNRGSIKANNVVFATNGFKEDKNLKGLISMAWSFIACYEDKGPNTPNSWDDIIKEAKGDLEKYHYWLRQDNILLIGGEDKPVIRGNTRNPSYEDEKDSFEKLKEWANKKFPQTKGKTPVATHYGLFCNTSDGLPIVGKFSEDSRISYILGCNGVGQNSLSYGASLIPGILGYVQMDEKQKKFAKLLSPERKTLKSELLI